MIGVRGGKNVAQALGVPVHRTLALLVAERRRDPVERVELAEQQTREPALLPLAQKLLDEPDARVLLLAGAAIFFLHFGHWEIPSSVLLTTGSGNLSRIDTFRL